VITNSDALEAQIAVVKVSKYASSESGDTFEMVERPLGGVSLVLADGQRSGRGAKQISNLVARKAISLLADGVRDGAAARAAHDYLYMHRGGKVQATLNIVSVDLVSKTLVLSRNSHCPVVMVQDGVPMVIDEPSSPIGLYQYTKPHIIEVPIVPSLCVVVFTDGFMSAGQRHGQQLDVVACIMANYQAKPSPTAESLAQNLLDEALALDRHRPADDISLLVVNMVAASRLPDREPVRRMHVNFPIPERWPSELLHGA
jgi:serine phosphatase RsbU (regulator of sigma subunit)